MTTQALIKEIYPSRLKGANGFLNPGSKTYGQEETAVYRPPVNIIETKRGFNLLLVAPGRKKNEFTIEVQANIITISYNSHPIPAEQDLDFIRNEFSYRSFCRSFALPCEIRLEKIIVGYRAGIFSLTLPK